MTSVALTIPVEIGTHYKSDVIVPRRKVNLFCVLFLTIMKQSPKDPSKERAASEN